MRNNPLSNDLIPVEYHSQVNENDPCHTFVPIEEIAEEIEDLDGENSFELTQASDDLEETEEQLEVEDEKVVYQHLLLDISKNTEEKDEVKFQKSPRQKFVDKVKSKTASVLAYSKRASQLSKFSPKKKRDDDKKNDKEPKAWRPADTKSREKKVPHKEKRAQRVSVAKMKITGFPSIQSEEFNIFDTITE